MNDITMGNQQDDVTEAELAWLCGIIEGEGSISMNARHKKWKGWDGFGVDIQIAIVNTDAGIIEGCALIFRRMGIEGRICEPRMRAPTETRTLNNSIVVQNKQQLVITICKMAAIRTVLTRIFPYFRGEKKARARLMLDYVIRRIHFLEKRGKAFIDAYDIDTIKKFYETTGRKFEPEKYGLPNDYSVRKYARAGGSA